MTTADDLPSDWVDVTFTVEGTSLPRGHRAALADAVERVLPWLRDEPQAAIHRLNLSAGAGPQALLSRRTRLTLRVPRARGADTLSLSHATLDIHGHALQLGEGHLRELLPWGALYAHVVVADGAADESAFIDRVQTELDALGVVGRVICGRAQVLEDDRLHGFSLMVDGLSGADALHLLRYGVGTQRRLGCGVFVPHKSAAAVGTPP